MYKYSRYNFKKKKTQENFQHFFLCLRFLLSNLDNSRFKVNSILNVTHSDLYLPQTFLLLGKNVLILHNCCEILLFFY